jgi:hypothetical protein
MTSIPTPTTPSNPTILPTIKIPITPQIESHLEEVIKSIDVKMDSLTVKLDDIKELLHAKNAPSTSNLEERFRKLHAMKE